MPFLVSSTQRPTTVVKAVAGNFLPDPKDEGQSYLAVGMVNRIALYSIVAVKSAFAPSGAPQRAKHIDPAASTKSPTECRSSLPDEANLALVDEFPLFASIIMMEAVPIICPLTGKLERHLLFVFTKKNEFAIFAFQRMSSCGATTKAGGKVGEDDEKVIKLVLLYMGSADSGCYQPHYDGAMLSAVTSVDMLLHGYRLSQGAIPPAPPLIAISVFHKTILIVDVACCLANHMGGEEPVKRKAKNAHSRGILKGIVSEGYLAHVIDTRKAYAPVNIQYLDETTLFSISFGFPALTPPNVAATLPVYILHTDHRMRTHVAEYSVSLEGTTAATGRGAAQGNVSELLHAAILGMDVAALATQSPLQWQRIGSLQTDVETEARSLVALRHGLVVVGPQLVTLIGHRMGKKFIATEAVPVMPRGPFEASCCAALPDHGGSVSKAVCAFANGTVLTISVKNTAEGDSEVVLLSGNPVDDLQLEVSLNYPPSDTAPECLVALDYTGRLFIGSMYGNSVSLQPKGATIVEIENSGPILDMAVVHEGSRASVVASSGLEAQGGLFILRTAVPFEELINLGDSMSDSVVRLHFFAPFAWITVRGRTRVLRFVVDDHNNEISSLDELGDDDEERGCPFVLHEETIFVASLEHERHTYLQVTTTTVRCVTVNPTNGVLIRSSEHTLTSPAVYASLTMIGSEAVLVIASGGNRISFLSVSSQRCEVIGSAVESENEVSCVCSNGDGIVVYGEWLHSKVTVLSLTKSNEGGLTVAPVASVVLPCVPRSVVLAQLPNTFSNVTIVCGLTDGSIAFVPLETSPDGTWTLHAFRQTKLSRQPVMLQLLPSDFSAVYSTVMCCCDAPAVIYEQRGRIAVVGIDLPEVDACGASNRLKNSPVPPLVVSCGNSIRFGSLRTLQKISRAPAPQAHHRTVTKLTYLSHFHAIAASIRRREKDEIHMIGMTAFDAQRSSVSAASLAASQHHNGSFTLFESERCNFVESVVIGGSNDKPLTDAAYRNRCTTVTKSMWSAEGWRDTPLNNFNAIVIGSSFVYPEESCPRTSRLIWGTLDEVTIGEKVFHQLGEKDFSGALTCCSVVPHCPSRMVVGLNGTVVLLKWHANDRSFVSEGMLAVGLSLVSLEPFFALDDSSVGVLVASDWKHSVAAVKVNPVDSSLELVARDAHIRGVMDSKVIQRRGHQLVAPIDNTPTLQGHEILFADEMMNIFAVSQQITEVAEGQQGRQQPSVIDDEEELLPPAQGASGSPSPGKQNGKAEASKKWTAKKQLTTVAQVHFGDTITSMAFGTFAPCTATSVDVAVRGCTGPQCVFGTSHGALGNIVPVAELPHRVYSLLEDAVVTLTPQLGAGFSYRNFREVYAIGQIRSSARNASYTSSGKDGNNIVSLSASHDERYMSKGFCDCDVIEHFLKLSAPLQKAVVEVVERRLRRDIADGAYGFPSKGIAPPAKKHPFLGIVGDSSIKGDDEATEREEPTEAEVDEANDVLLKWRLPRLPLTLNEVRELVVDLMSTH